VAIGFYNSNIDNNSYKINTHLLYTILTKFYEDFFKVTLQFDEPKQSEPKRSKIALEFRTEHIKFFIPGS